MLRESSHSSSSPPPGVISANRGSSNCFASVPSTFRISPLIRDGSALLCMVRMKWRPVTSTLADATPGMASSCANTGARIEPQPRPGAGPQPKLREWKQMQRASAAVALMIAPPSMKDSWPLGGSRSRDAKVMKCRLPDGPILQTRPTPVHNQTYGASAQRCGSLPPDGTPRMQSSWRHLLHFRRRSLPVRGPRWD
jgi:hypothetical protein